MSVLRDQEICGQEKFAPDRVFQDKLVLGDRPDQDQDRRSVVHITLHRSLLGPHPGPTTKQRALKPS